MAKVGHLAIASHDQRKAAIEINRLHAEILTLMLNSAEKAVRVGELLMRLKLRIPHGNWRRWCERSLDFSYRTARRYLHTYFNRDKIKGAKNVYNAEKLLLSAAKLKGKGAVEADYARLDRDLIAPIRFVRRRLHGVTYVGDTPETIDMIMEELRNQVAGLLKDLE